VPLEKRELPSRSSFSSPHIQSYRGAQFFWQLLEAQWAEVQRQAELAGGGDDALFEAAMPGALERQAISEAVQVFCAMTVEGATNLFGMLVLGEDQFVRELERRSAARKLKELVRLVDDREMANDDSLLLPVERLMAARHSYVHPKSQEGEWRQSTGRRANLESARAAIQDVHLFFDALQALPLRYAGLIRLF
jgi:hypothetical protein